MDGKPLITANILLSLPKALYLPITNKDIAVNINCIKAGSVTKGDYSVSVFSSRTQYDTFYLSNVFGNPNKRINIPCTNIFTNSDGHTVYIFYNKSSTNSTNVINAKGNPLPQVLNNIQVKTYIENGVQRYFITICSNQHSINRSNIVTDIDTQTVIDIPITEFYKAANYETIL
jgi:hypothetical protein